MDVETIQSSEKSHEIQKNESISDRRDHFIHILKKKIHEVNDNFNKQFDARGYVIDEMIMGAKLTRLIDRHYMRIEWYQREIERLQMVSEDSFQRQIQASEWTGWLWKCQQEFLQAAESSINTQIDKFKKRVDTFTKHLVDVLHPRSHISQETLDKSLVLSNAIYTLQQQLQMNVWYGHNDDTLFDAFELYGNIKGQVPNKMNDDNDKSNKENDNDNDDQSQEQQDNNDDDDDENEKKQTKVRSRAHGTHEVSFALGETDIVIILIERLVVLQSAARRRVADGTAIGASVDIIWCQKAVKLLLEIFEWLEDFNKKKHYHHVEWTEHSLVIILANLIKAFRNVIDAVESNSGELTNECFELFQENDVPKKYRIDRGLGRRLLSQHCLYWLEILLRTKRVSHLSTGSGYEDAAYSEFEDVDEDLEPEVEGDNKIFHRNEDEDDDNNYDDDDDDDVTNKSNSNNLEVNKKEVDTETEAEVDVEVISQAPSLAASQAPSQAPSQTYSQTDSETQTQIEVDDFQIAPDMNIPSAFQPMSMQDVYTELGLHDNYLSLQHITKTGSAVIRDLLHVCGILLGSDLGEHRQQMVDVGGGGGRATTNANANNSNSSSSSSSRPNSRNRRRGNIGLASNNIDTSAHNSQQHALLGTISDVFSIPVTDTVYTELLDLCLQFSLSLSDTTAVAVNAVAGKILHEDGSITTDAEYQYTIAPTLTVHSESLHEELLEAINLALIAASVGHFTGPFVDLYNSIYKIIKVRPYSNTVCANWMHLTQVTLLACFKGVHQSSPNTYGWSHSNALGVLAIGCEPTLKSIVQTSVLEVTICIITNHFHSEMTCRLGLLLMRLLINDTMIPKREIDTVLSRGDEDVDERTAPEYEQLLDPATVVEEGGDAGEGIRSRPMSRQRPVPTSTPATITTSVDSDPTKATSSTTTKVESPSQGQSSPTTTAAAEASTTTPTHSPSIRGKKKPDKEKLRSEEVSDDVLKEIHQEVWLTVDAALREIYPDACVILPKLPNLFYKILKAQGHSTLVMEQWCLLLLHIGNMSQLGLSGLREMAGGSVTEDIHKMMMMHLQDAYLVALAELVIEMIDDPSR